MWITMAIKSTCFVIISMAVFFCKCTAVTVTVENIGDVVEGAETRITCNIARSSSSSVQTPIVSWNNITNDGIDQIAQYQGGAGFVQPSYMDRFSVDGDTTLVIANTARSDSGTYQCSVSVLDDPPSPASDDVTLSVIYLYKPELNSVDAPVNEGSMVEMSCSVDANPAPTYTFKKDGVVEQQGGLSTLTFQTVSRDNNGNYECEASNGADTLMSDSRLLEVYYAPDITPLSNMEVSPGDEVVISFVVVAKPTATFVWITTPPTIDTDSNPETYTFTVSDSIDETYTVTVNASNTVGATQASVEVKVVARITTLIYTTTNAITTLPPSASCGVLSIEVESPDVEKTDNNITVMIGDEVVLDCRCGTTSSDAFQFRWTLNGEDSGDNEQLSFKAEDGGHNVVCTGTAGAPNPSQVELRVNVAETGATTDDSLGTGAIVGIVIGIIAMLVILAVVVVIVLKSRDAETSNKNTDSAYMDVTWDTKDPNRVNQGKKTAPPINGNTKQEAAKLLESDTPKPSTAEPDPYEKYDRYGDERAYSRTSYGDDYNDKPDDDDYANSMPVTV